MKRNAGGIQSHHNLILHKKNSHRIGSPVLRKPLQMTGLLHPLHHCFFCDGLNVGRAEQLALDRGGLGHPEFCICRKIFFPGQRPDPLKQFLKGSGVKTSYQKKNTLCAAQENICPADSLRIPFKSDPAILYPGNFITQIIYFSFCHCLQTKMAGCNQFICFHFPLIPYSMFFVPSIVTHLRNF